MVSPITALYSTPRRSVLGNKPCVEKPLPSNFALPADEYARLFDLAIKDHDQAIALAPASAEAYCRRGEAYYDRAVLEVVVNGSLVGDKATWHLWFDPSIADLMVALSRFPWDMRTATGFTLEPFAIY